LLGNDSGLNLIFREEYNALEAHCKAKKLVVRNEIGDDSSQYFDAEGSGRKRAAVDYEDDLNGSESGKYALLFYFIF
jgi:hypothetical protein